MNEQLLQIGVIGSACDAEQQTEQYELARAIGEELSKASTILMYGAEKDTNSLSTEVAKSMRENGGFVIGLTYGKTRDIFGEANAVIATGLERGGGREMALCFSCDTLITIGGGSGTLTEMGIAYQARVPMVALKNSGGWSEKMAGTYLDERKRILISSADSPKQAVELAVELATERRNK